MELRAAMAPSFPLSQSTTMDYLSAHHTTQSAATLTPSVDNFAQEIGRRFSLPTCQSLRRSPITATATIPANTTPVVHIGNLTLRSRPPISTSSPASNIRATAVPPASLHTILDAQGLLVLDIRPYRTFTISRLPHALPLSVPSTLLKRPAFSLEKLAAMLPLPSCRHRFTSWKSASRILVYDADSQSISEGSIILGLLRKFESEGFKGDLLWLQGGFSSVWRDFRSLVDDKLPPQDASEEDSPSGLLCTKKLPPSAFQQASTTTASRRPTICSSPTEAQSGPLHYKPLPVNPFYDNIRQNRELQHGVMERIPLRLPPAVVARRDDLPFEWLKEIVDKVDADDGAESLAMQFYMIELREQRRLMGIMDHHSREANTTVRMPFPYSITAGVEKGSKNRYNNIWPFEHARVRLNAPCPDDGSDYINASHVQPLGTSRRYIATQGPLPTTFVDFWTLCWEQQVRIIIMLTKEMEGATIKCGSYWKETCYGPLRLQHVSSSGAGERESTTPSGFDFGVSASEQPSDHIVRRTFLLSHTEYPDEPARKITQLQYLAWPDFDVPEDPRGLLDLMKEADTLRAEVEDPGPVLLHCSAGIGRTGGFIAADAALDGIRQEMRLRRTVKVSPSRDDIKLSGSTGAMSMDVDTHNPASPIQSHSPIAPSSPSQSQTQQSRQGDASPAHLSPYSLTSSARGQLIQLDDKEADSNCDLSEDSKQRSSSLGSTSSALSAIFSDADFGASSPQSVGLPCLSLSESPNAMSCLHNNFVIGPTSNSTSLTSTTSLPFSSSLTDSKSISTAPMSIQSSCASSPAREMSFSLLPFPLPPFDYAIPRKLHDTISPKLLSSLTDPVRKLLDDMREQRMSLCQSLRQYVFVHRTIVEGALDIVDEERERGGGGVAMGKRGRSLTELTMDDGTDAVRLSKRPSTDRRHRNGKGEQRGAVGVMAVP